MGQGHEPPDIEDAVTQFLRAIEQDTHPETSKTPQRVATFWREHLLVGEQKKASLKVEGMPAESQDPVMLREIDLHLVCPHHLTIGMGRGSLAYIPGTQWFGLGTLADILQAATARCILQEQATRDAVDWAFDLLRPRAAYVQLSFLHPCHNAHYGADARAEVVTEAFRSQDEAARDALSAMLQRVVQRPGTVSREP